VGVGVLIWTGKRFRIKPPGLFALYVSWYTFGRFFEELLRIDPSHHIAGLRLNAWVSILVFCCSTGFFVWWQFFHDSTPGEKPQQRRKIPEGPAMAIPRGRVR
jgi:phosphatidylglycerol---prolipoprotein diacylglyceryl transferase